MAITGTCGTKKPTTPARTVITASGQSRLNITAPGSCSGSVLVRRASASRPAIPALASGVRPSQSPARAATHHQTAAT